MLSKIFFDKKILIYGLGLSGNSCLQYLQKKNKVKIYDDNSSLKNKENKKYFLDKKNILKNKFDYIVLSPGIDINKCELKTYLLKNLNKIITELDIFYLSYPDNTKITITGTNGKSSVCLMLYKIFKSKRLDIRLVGNIGKPPLRELNIKKKTIFIIEASSYQIFYNRYFKTNYGVILNLGIDHLERHGNIKNYANAKIKLLYEQEKNNFSFIEKDNVLINKNIISSDIKSKIIKISYNKYSFFKKKIKNNYLLDDNSLKIIHFIYQISKLFKIADNKIFKSMNTYKGLKFRKQVIYNNSNLKIINDSKSTSFSSTIGLLSNYKNIYWIVGGKFKKYDKFNLNYEYCKNITAYIFGLNKKFFVNQFENKIKFKYIKNLEKVILTIKKDIKNDNKKKIVLFSPAAASFDQFKNFEHRGRYFNSLIKKIGLYGK